MTSLPTKLIVLGVVVAASAAMAQNTPQQLMDRKLAAVRQSNFAYGLTLREGYDSNIYTRENNVVGSFSTTMSPDFHFGWSNPNTDIGMHYTYSAVYYDRRTDRQWDQSHDFNFNILHQFSPRLSVSLTDNFSPGFEPDLDTGTSQRSADYIQNRATVEGTYALSSRWDLTLSASHFFIRYDDNTSLAFLPGTPIAQTMNRQSVDVHTFVKYKPRSTTTVALGLGYQATNYEGKDRSNSGESFSLGVRHSFSPRLGADATIGGVVQTFNAVGGTSLNPDVSAGLNYMATSRTSLGFRFATRMQPTEVDNYLEQQTMMFSGSVVHQFTSKLMGSASLQFVPTEYDSSLVFPGSPITGNNEEDSLGGSCMLAYQFNLHLRGEIGYSFTHFSSDFVNRSHDRHMTYLQARIGF
jgi:hypothetical protein